MGRLLLKTPAEIEAESVKPEEVSAWEGFKSGFAIQNPLANPIMNYDQPDTEDIQGYSPYDDDEEINGYAPSDFSRSNSPAETEQIKSNIDREREMRVEASQDGFGLAGEIVGSITNPIIWGGLLMPEVGLPALIATEVGLEAASEAILQSQQYERTLAESALNVATAGIATYGVTKIMVARVDWAAAKKAELNGETYSGVPGDDELADTYSEMHGANMAEGESVARQDVVDQGVDRAGQEASDGTTGAMRVDQVTMEDVTPLGANTTMKLAVGPLKDLMKSPVKEVRLIAQRLAENPFITKGMVEGKTAGVPVEALVKNYAGKEATATYEMARRFKEYKARTAGDGERLNQIQFDEATGAAMSNADKHAIPEVQAAARYYRETILDPLLKEAQDLNLLPRSQDWYTRKLAKETDPDEIANLKKLRSEAQLTLTKFAKSYFPRVYDRNLIHENYASVKNLIVTKFRNGNEFTAEEVEDAAVATIRNMLGGSPLKLTGGKSGKTSSLQKRVLELEDSDLQPFLDKRASVVVGKHAQGLGPHIEFRKKFGDFEDTLDDINIKYDELLDRAVDGKARKEIIKVREKDASAIKTIKDRIMGDKQISLDPRGTASKVVQRFKTFNVATQLGDIVLSSASDVVRPIAITGFTPYAKGIAKVISEVFRNTPGRANINRMGIAVERTLNTRQAAMTMTKDPIDKVVPTANRIWGIASGFNVWTDTMESVAAYAVQDHIIRNAQKVFAGKALKQADITRLARAGLDNDMLMRIGEMTQKETGLLKEGRTASWSDYEAARSFEGAVIGDVQMSIIRPGAGDIPTFMDNEYASLMAQYTSFGFASTNRMLINGMQLGDLRAAETLLSMVILGSVVGAAKAYKRGDDPTKWSAEKFVFEGVDRSGILGIYRFLNSWAAVGMGETPSRYLTRDAESIFGGPTVGTLGKIGRLGVAAGQALGGDTKALEDTKHLRLIPYANSMGMLDTMIQLGE